MPDILKEQFSLGQGHAGMSAVLYVQFASLVGVGLGGWLADRSPSAITLPEIKKRSGGSPTWSPTVALRRSKILCKAGKAVSASK